MSVDPCESLLRVTPVNPRTAEGYRRTTAESARREQQLLRWLENDPEDPWPLATFGATLIELGLAHGRDPLKRALTFFDAAGSPAGEALALARDAHHHRNIEAVGAAEAA